MDKIIRYFAKNRLLINLLIIIIIIIGISSMFQLKQNVYPELSADVMVVTVIYPGAAAIDVELNAIIPIEKKLEEISGIKEYFSISSENSGRIVIYIDEDEGDKKAVTDEIFRELSNVSDMADEVEDVKIMNLGSSNLPVYQIGVNLKKDSNLSEKELYAYVDVLEKKMLKINGISTIQKEGYSDREIKINVEPDKMIKYYISLSDIVNSIKTRNIRVTSGALQSVIKDKTIVTIGQFDDPMEVKEVIIRSNFEESRVRIKNIANVEDGFKKSNVEVKVNTQEGVTLQMHKKESADTVKIVKNLKKFLKSIEKDIPEGIEISRIEDWSLSITSLLKVVSSNALIGFILVFVILFIFLLDFRTSFWTAFGIPITILLAMTSMKFIGFSLNILSLGALITVMGMLVDHGIVISENIYEHKFNGLSPIDATIKGIKEVIAPVSVTILTTIVAFFPLFFIGGLMGKFIQVFPTVVILALLASFFEAVFILPNHLAHGRHKLERKNWFAPIAAGYEKFLQVILKFRYLVVLLFIGIFIFTILISTETIRNFVLMDDDTSDKIVIQLESAEGTNLSTTSKYTDKVEEAIYNEVLPEELISVKTVSGHHDENPLSGEGFYENRALVQINLAPLTERKRKAREIVNVLRKKINVENLDEFEKIIIEENLMGVPVGNPIDIKIFYEDKKEAQKVKKEIKDYLASIDGVIYIDDDQKEGRDELKIDFNYNAQAKMGLNVETVARTIRTAYEGTVATSIQTPKKELDFRVKIDDSFQRDKKFLMNLLIPNKYGRLIRLKDISMIIPQRSISTINHYNGDRLITVTASVEAGKTTPAQVTTMVKDRFYNINKKYPGIEITYEGEAKNTSEALGDIAVAFAIALILIYFILIILFKSMSQPLIVMITIPFGIIGAMVGFITHGMPLSFFGMIGIIGLSGVVVNDSLIMVDFINRVFRDNNDKKHIKKLIAQGKQKKD